MATKKTSIEELEQQYLESEKTTKMLLEQFLQAKREEEEKKRAKLEAEKQKRYDEVIAAYEKFEKLRIKFVDDYGRFTFKADCEFDWLWKTIGMM